MSDAQSEFVTRVICPPPIKAKHYGRGVSVAGFVAGVIFLSVLLAKALLGYRERSKVYITSGRVSFDPVNIIDGHPVKTFGILVRNASRSAIRDIHVTWLHHGQSGTSLGTYDLTFYETVEAGNMRRFQTGFVQLPDQTASSEAFIRDFEFVR